MSEPLLTPLISGDEIKAELRKRRSPDIFNTIYASNPALLKEKVKLEEADGWRIDRKNPKSYRMAQKKPSDELLEDELWCLMAQMGFKELSLGRNFQMVVENNLPSRQIDVFGKDDETAILIECTQTKKPITKDMSALIDKLKTFREGVHESITTHYGRDARLKTKLVIATRNINWRKVDIKKCNEAGIAIIADDELEYYKGLVLHLKEAARYQLLAHLFAGTGIGGLARKVAATQGTMGGVKFYNFLIHPDELLKIAYIGHKSSRKTENLETYQRMLKPDRLKTIGGYIANGGKFPTNIVVNIKTKRPLVFEQKEKVGEESFGILSLPGNYASAWIIDGQHRLYGFLYAEVTDHGRGMKSTIPVLAFENLSAVDEMNMFIDINSKQKKVLPGLLVELYADLHWGSVDAAQHHLALLARIAAQLNSTKTSPICERVQVSGKKRNSYRCLTQKSLSDGLAVSNLLGRVSKDKYVLGPLSGSDPEQWGGSLDKAVLVISQCLQQFAEAMPEHWKIGDARGGYLCTNNAIRAIFLLIGDICDHVAKETRIDLSLLTADEVVEDIVPLLRPVVEFFADANAEKISAFRRTGSSLTAVKQQSRGMGVFVRKAFPGFNPVGLKEYIQSRDEAGTEDAAKKINQIQRKIFRYVKATLRTEFGENGNDWWVKGIPSSVSRKTVKAWDDDGRVNPEENYLYLIQYQDIAIANWELMKNVFALGNKDIDNKAGLCEMDQTIE